VKVLRDLNRAPENYVRLHLSLEPGRSASEKVSGSKTPPLPLQLRILDAASAYARVLGEWEELVCQDASLSRPSSMVRESFAVARAVKILSPRVDSACRVAPGSAVALASTTTTARRLLGVTRLIHRLEAPCPGCGVFGLNREDGAAVVRCVNCHAGWSEELYAHLVYVITSEYADEPLDLPAS
jgi:hypothetical protein